MLRARIARILRRKCELQKKNGVKKSHVAIYVAGTRGRGVTSSSGKMEIGKCNTLSLRLNGETAVFHITPEQLSGLRLLKDVRRFVIDLYYYSASNDSRAARTITIHVVYSLEAI